MDDYLTGGPPTEETGEPGSAPSYWRRENHAAGSYLRADRWEEDVKEWMLPTAESRVVKLPYDGGQALLRWREEAKMYSSLETEQRAARTGFQDPSAPADALHDPAFLDQHQERVEREWPGSAARGPWFESLDSLRLALDEAVKAVDTGDGAFVKLSVRSPKDAVFDLTKTASLMRERVAASELAPGHPDALSDDIRAIKWATWKAMAVRDGAEALQLLLRSDRVYVDVLQHALFNCSKGGSEAAQSEAFDLQIHVRAFFAGFDPEFEFRGFVVGGKRTALTAYSPWVFEPRIVERKDDVLAVVNRLWDQAQPCIRAEDYSIDFAVASDLSQAWIVEINAFLPPLAGCGVFDYSSPADRSVLEGVSPFEFRVCERPIVEADFRTTRVDESGKVTTMEMRPAPPHIMAMLREARSGGGGGAAAFTCKSDASVEGGRKCALM